MLGSEITIGGKHMTQNQKDSLIREFNTIDTHLQQAIIQGFKKKFKTEPGGDRWFDYLRQALTIEVYWKAVGQSR